MIVTHLLRDPVTFNFPTNFSLTAQLTNNQIGIFDDTFQSDRKNILKEVNKLIVPFSDYKFKLITQKNHKLIRIHRLYQFSNVENVS